MIVLLTFMLLMCSHFLCDFALQNDYIAKAKNKNLPLGSTDSVWVIVLTAHAAIHTLGVLVVGLYLFEGKHLDLVVIAALFQFVTHWIIDYVKCEGKISYWCDQLLHIAIVVVITVMYGSILVNL